MKKLVIIAAVLTVISYVAIAQSQWRGPNRDGIYNETNLMKQWPAEGPRMLWSYEALGTGQGSVVVSKDKVFVTGIPDTLNADGYLFAFDNKGKLLWKKNYGKDWTGIFPGARSTPTVVNDLIYVESGNGVVYCLKSETGEQVWSIDFFKDLQADSVQFGYSESLLVDGDRLYCTPGGKTNNVVALNRFTGKKIWASTAYKEKASYCSPIIFNHNGQKIFANLTSTSIIGLNAETGEMLWRVHQFQDNKIHANTPVYADGKLFVLSASRKDSSGLVMLQLSPDGKKADIAWRNKEYINLMGGFILKDGYIYGSAHIQPKWYCVDITTGQSKYIAKELGGGPVIYADGHFYCYAEKDGEMALAEGTPEHFTIISKFKVPLGTAQHWAHPVISDGKLYIRHNNALMVYYIKNN